MNKDVFYLYLEIKQDLLNNLRDVFNRQNYYTRKYRGNADTDINVYLAVDNDKNKVIRLFVRNNGEWIKDEIIFNSKGIVKTKIKSNLI